jgi:hypothetical protein
MARIWTIAPGLIALIDLASSSGVFRPFICSCSIDEPLFPTENPGLGVVGHVVVVHLCRRGAASILGNDLDFQSVLAASHAYGPGNSTET